MLSNSAIDRGSEEIEDRGGRPPYKHIDVQAIMDAWVRLNVHMWASEQGYRVMIGSWGT